MARYYFHIKDGADLIKDQEGTELATPRCRPRASPEVRTRAVGRRNQIGQTSGR